VDRDRQIYDEYEDVYLNLRRMFSAARHHRMNSNRRANAERQLQAIERSRAWKISQLLITLKTRALALRRRALGLLRRRTLGLLRRR